MELSGNEGGEDEEEEEEEEEAEDEEDDDESGDDDDEPNVIINKEVVDEDHDESYEFGDAPVRNPREKANDAVVWRLPGVTCVF